MMIQDTQNRAMRLVDLWSNPQRAGDRPYDPPWVSNSNSMSAYREGPFVLVIIDVIPNPPTRWTGITPPLTACGYVETGEKLYHVIREHADGWLGALHVYGGPREYGWLGGDGPNHLQWEPGAPLQWDTVAGDPQHWGWVRGCLGDRLITYRNVDVSLRVYGDTSSEVSDVVVRHTSSAG